VKRLLWVAAVLAVGLAACTGIRKNEASPSPAATSSAASTDFKSAAEKLVDDLAAGNYDAVESRFDVTMKSQLPRAQLENGWRTFQESEGNYKSHGAANAVMKGQLTVERVPITTATGTGEVRVSYHPDGTIAGLFFLKAGAPPP